MIELPLPAPWRAWAIVVHDVEDPESWLSDDELAVVRAFKHEKRRREWMLARIAAKRLAQKLGIADNPRRFRADRPTVSFSHSGPYGAAAFAGAIDIEVVREVDERVARHFLTADEEAQMRRCTIAHRLLHFWCAKEAEWKRRLGATPLLRDIPLNLVEERENGLNFDVAETIAIGDVVVGVTRHPTF